MKNNILKYFILLLSVLVVFTVYLSTAGIETDKFNDQIKKRILLINKKIEVDLKNIKFILDPFKLKVYAKTVGTTVYFSKRPLALESIKTQVSLGSLIKNKISSSNIEITTKSILLNDLIKFIRTTNNKTELFLLEKIVKKGYVILDLTLNIDENGNLKNDYKIEGLIKDASINLLNKANLKNINFNFNFQKDNYIFNGINFQLDEVEFISKKLNVKKKKNSFLIDAIVENDQSSLNSNILKFFDLSFENIIIDDAKFKTNNKFSLEIDEKFKVKNIILSSDVNITQLKYKKLELINNFFPEVDDLILLNNHKLNLNYKDNNLSINGEGKVQLNAEEADEIKYLINKKDKDLSIESELFLKNIVLGQQDFLKIFFPQINKNINFNNQKLKINFKDNKLTFSGSGKFKIDKNFEQIDYFVEKKENKISFNTNLNVKHTKFKIDNINYKKKDKSKMNLLINGELINNKNLNINNFIINEENNNIKIKDLYLNDSNQIIKIDQANFNYLDSENIKNNYNINKLEGQNYLIDGTSFNANSLLSNLLDSVDKKENNLFENNVSMELNFEEVYLDKIHFVKDLNGKIKIINNKVEQADILAFYNDLQNIKFTIITNDQGEKITTLFSSKAKPLVDRYKFIKGFKDDKEGYLDFYSLKKDGVSTSKLVIDNFKVKEIPALAKLLALASLQGIADLLTGEGIRFTDFEMIFTNQDKLMKIQELYAIGPAISILLEGYIEEDKLISLRGTLVPATTINRSIASIPLLGDLLIGKKVGDGVFGVSFKIKGPPKNLETTVNPIKTLTPRFITRTLEKIKKN
ncbi:hypothetical protein [Candidatus Pelagibacter sp.]|uniref:hypothetical protein n=1 Tax=Candidatus Pelagibacter sp. TaxID=2024849 RepID=UPI003F857F38